MATVCYASTGSNTAPYETWAKAATTFATALGAVTDGDDLHFDMANVASADAEVAGTTTWTVPAGVTITIGTQNGASGITKGSMGTTYWLGNSTVSRIITLTFTGSCRILGGLTIREAGSSNVTINSSDGGAPDIEDLYFWSSATASNCSLLLGVASANSFVRIGTLYCDYDRTTASASEVQFGGRVHIDSLTMDFLTGTGGAHLLGNNTGQNGMCHVTIGGGDLSSASSGSDLVGDCTRGAAHFYLDNVILPASFVMLSAQTLGNASSAHLYLHDCSSSGIAVPFAYADALGTLLVDTGIFLTAGVAGKSWKITTTAACGPTAPFYSPWFREYKLEDTVEPASEVLRDGSATAYTDAQLWKDTLTKQTASSVRTTLNTTRGTGTNVPTGAGLGAWTGEGGTAWSGELSVGEIVLNEDGFILSRIGFAAASSTVYVDVGPVLVP